MCPEVGPRRDDTEDNAVMSTRTHMLIDRYTNCVCCVTCWMHESKLVACAFGEMADSNCEAIALAC